MPDTTSRFALRHPESGDAVTLATYFGNLADDADAIILGWSQGTAAARPSAGTAGRLYHATDTDAVSLDDGAEWLDLLRSGGTALSFLALNRNELRTAKLKDYTETVSTVGASGSSQTIALATANVWDVTLSANCTFSFSGMRSGELSTATLILRNDGTGRTPTFTGVLWPEATAPDLTAVNSVHLLTFFSVDGGSTKYGVAGALNFG